MSKVVRQYEFNVGKGPYHRSAAELPESPPTSHPVRFIAYYLPQFHAIPENDEWWGAGFTEWTNVSKALPRYIGHQQPRLPADLGFYDLRHVEVLRRQADLARRAGIYGFCIHDYWFSGRKVLETPLQLLLQNPDIDLPFCINWANENWTRRWDGSESDILLEQQYAPGDDLAYIRSILPALRDPRYIKIDGRPLIMVYRAAAMPDPQTWMSRWRSILIEEGVGDPYLVIPQVFEDYDPRPYGMDAAAGFPPHGVGFGLRRERNRLPLIDRRFAGSAQSYAEVMERILANGSPEYRLFPGVCPSWDNEARKPGRGFSLYGANPEIYAEWLRRAAEKTLSFDEAEERIVFINAWNEWAEGAVLEPDRHNGYAYLTATRRIVDEMNGDRASPPASEEYRSSAPPTTAPTRFHSVVNRFWDLREKMVGGLAKRS